MFFIKLYIISDNSIIRQLSIRLIQTLIIALGLVLALGNFTYAQTTITLTATEDAGIWNNNASDELKNYGGCNILYINGPSGTAKDRSLIQYNLSTIPANATITSAAIRLIKIGGATSARNMSIHRVTADWTEGSQGCSGAAGVCNWQQRMTSTAWTAPGGDFDATATATLSVAANGTYDFTATNLVQSWVSGTNSNFGIIFKFTTENLNSVVQFASSEHTTAANRPQLIITYTVPTLSTNVTNASCSTSSNGAINLTVTGGTSPYSYSWSNGATTQNLSNLSAGTYSVTVTDSKGATATASATVSSGNSTASIGGSVAAVSTSGGTDGAIDVSLIGGSSPFTYNWSNSKTTQDIFGLSAGNYTLTLTENNGCISTKTFTVPTLLANKQLYLSDPSQALDRTDPVASLDATTAQTSVLGTTSSNSITITSDKSTLIYQGGNTKNYGSCSTIEVEPDANYIVKSLVEFNLSSIPSGATITGATLRLVHGTSSFNESGDPFTTNIKRLTRSWVEGTACDASQTGSATWLSAGTTNWTTAGGDAASTVYGSFVGGAADAVGTVYTINVMNLVNEWYNGTNTNYGLMLEPGTDPNGGDEWYEIWSDDASNSNDRPQLIITYTLPGNPSTTFTQNPTLCSPLTIKSNQTLTVKNYITVTSGSMPTNPNITATLKYGSTVIATMSNPTYNSGTGLLTWTNMLGSDVTIPAGQAIALDVTNSQSGVSIKIDYDSQTKPSLIDLPVSTFINISSVAMYNAPYPGGTIITTATPGSTVYFRANVTDPFGTSDITGMKISITSPGGSISNVTGTSVATSGCTRTYEYTWVTPTIGGNYTFNTTTSEGLEDKVIDAEQLNFALCAVAGSITSQTNVKCFGGSIGSITAVGSSGTLPFQYKLGTSAYQSSGTFSSLVAGNYIITVKDANNCTATVSATITQPSSALTSTVVAIQPQCFAFGSISLNVSGGTAPYTYDWSDITGNINPKDRSGLSGGTYTVQITDANGCMSTANVTLNTPTGCAPVNVCQSSTNYIFSVAPDPTNTSYTWTIPAGAIIVSGLGTHQIVVNMTGVASNTYQVCVKANNACGTSAQTCQEINVITPIANASANPVCSGATLQFFANGGSIYSWSGPSGFSSASTNPVIFNATTANNGTYTVTVTDINGCRASATTNVTVNPSPTASTIATNTACGLNNGAVNATVSGGTSPYTYAWSNGATTQNITQLVSGVYNLTVTDLNGCKITTNGTVTSSTGPVITKTQTNILCAGSNTGSIITAVTGGTSPYSYSWSNGATSPNLSNLAAGTYILTVVDALGCDNQISVTITQPTAIQTDYTKIDVKCFGQLTGSINLIASGGTGAYTYSWTKNGTAIPNTTANLTALGAGVYVATINDANNCTATQSITITQPNAVLNATAAITNINCSGNTNGQIVLTVTGGTAPYIYSWTGPSGYTASTKDLSGRSAGTYNVTITDANNCTFVLNNLNITAPAALSIGTPTTNSVNCFGGNNGSITLAISGGTSPYTFLWSNGATTNNLTGLVAGSYTLTVTDANNCKAISSSIIVTQPATALVATATPTNPNCAGTNTGSINLAVSGGTSPFTFAWSNSSTTQSLSGLAAGIYTVLITDSKGCTTQANATLINPTAINISATVTNILCNGGNTGSITLTVSGGTGALSYVWADGPTTPNRTGLSAGNYSVTVTDANGCNSVKSFVITQSTAIIHSLIKTNVSCFGASNGSVNLTVTGGVAPYTFTWSNGQTTEDISGLTAGTYSVVIKDANNCTVTSTATAIIQPSPLNVAANNGNNVTCKDGNNGSATGVVSGGTAPYNYLWSNGSVTQSATGLTEGTYNLIVTDAAGCIAQDTVSIGQPGTALTVFANTIKVSSCGGNTGSIGLVIEGGSSPYNFVWTGPTTIGNVQNPTNLSVGTYSVTVSDALGCVSTLSVILSQAPALVVTTILENTPCTGNFANATASVSGGTESYSYLWMPGNFTSQTLSVLTAGTYNVTITDARGCTATATTNITFNPTPSATLANISICLGQSTTLTPTNVLNTSSYLWSINDVETTNTTASIAVSPTTNTLYSLLLTSSAGCTEELRALVTVNPIPPKPTFANGVACQGEVISLTATSDVGMTVIWTFGGSTMTTAPIPNTSNPGLVVYYVTQKNNTTGCMSESSVQTLTVYPKPIAEVNTTDVTCLSNYPQSNASIRLTKYFDSDDFAYGITLPSQPNYTSVRTLTNGIIRNDLPNVATSYIVRIKNVYGCTIDRIAPITQITCPCPTNYCNPPIVTNN
jgi:hypothetical protein